MEEVVSFENALAEVSKWLDGKKVLPKRRERSAATIENIAEAIQYGIIALNADGSIKHTLQFPLLDDKGAPTLTELGYRSRINTDEVLKAVAKLNVSTPDAQLIANIAVATGQPYAFITKLDPADLVVAKSIGVFFMS